MSQTIDEWYLSLPMYTKILGTGMFASTLLYTVGMLNPYLILFDATKIIGSFQVWRILTDFFFIGKFSFAFLMDIMFLAQFGGKLEGNDVFVGRNASPGSFLFFILFQMVTILTLGLITSFPVGSQMNGRALIFGIIYYWSRREPYEQLSFYGFRVPAVALPFVLLVSDLAFGAGIWADLLGIAAGHIYYFVFDLMPDTYNVQLDHLRNPKFADSLHQLIKDGMQRIGAHSLTSYGQGFYVQPARERDTGGEGPQTAREETSNVRQRMPGSGQRLGGTNE